MRILYGIIFFMLCFTSTLQAQVFEVDTLVKNGPLNKRLNLVFMGDGYTAGEQDKFIADVQGVVTKIFNVKPLKEYEPYFNVFAIRVISNQSGAKHPQTTNESGCSGLPVSTVDNYFGSTFDYGGIHRLLYPTQPGKIGTVLSQHLPNYSQAFIIVNSTHYGGAGGSWATSSVHSSAPEIAIHEIGHSFAGLADEYWAGEQYAYERPNLTQQSDANLVKWKNWVGTNGIGVIAHTESPSWYRPHPDCKMRSLNKPFCSVCIETFIERIHALTNPVLQYAPVQSVVPLPEAGQSLEFSLNLLKAVPNTLRIVWQQNGNIVARNHDSFSLPVSEAMEGDISIQATVMDTTALTRSNGHQSHVYTIQWTVNPIVTGAEISVVESEYELLLYPNPVERDLNINYSLSRPVNVNIAITDATGKIIHTVAPGNQPAGKHTLTLPADKIFRNSGLYFVTTSFNDAQVTHKIVVR